MNSVIFFLATWTLMAKARDCAVFPSEEPRDRRAGAADPVLVSDWVGARGIIQDPAGAGHDRRELSAVFFSRHGDFDYSFHRHFLDDLRH